MELLKTLFALYGISQLIWLAIKPKITTPDFTLSTSITLLCAMHEHLNDTEKLSASISLWNDINFNNIHELQFRLLKQRLTDIEKERNNNISEYGNNTKNNKGLSG